MPAAEHQAESFKLVCLDGPERNREFPLDGDEVRIGASADCLVRIAEARRSVRLARASGRWTVSDAPPGAVLVNGQPVQGQRPLAPGDVLAVSGVRLLFAEGEQTVLNAEAARSGPDDERTIAGPGLLRRTSEPSFVATAADMLPPGERTVAVTRTQAVNVDDEATVTRPKAMDDEATRAAVRNRPVSKRRPVESGLHLKPMIIAASVATALLLPAVVYRLWTSRDRTEDLQRRIRQATAAMRERRFADARQTLKALEQEAEVGVLLARADREEANDRALASARGALKEKRLQAAAAALSQVSADTMFASELRALKGQLDEGVRQAVSDAKQALAAGDRQRAASLAADVLAVEPGHPEAAAVQRQAAAR